MPKEELSNMPEVEPADWVDIKVIVRQQLSGDTVTIARPIERSYPGTTEKEQLREILFEIARGHIPNGVASSVDISISVVDETLRLPFDNVWGWQLRDFPSDDDLVVNFCIMLLEKLARDEGRTSTVSKPASRSSPNHTQAPRATRRVEARITTFEGSSTVTFKLPGTTATDKLIARIEDRVVDKFLWMCCVARFNVQIGSEQSSFVPAERGKLLHEYVGADEPVITMFVWVDFVKPTIENLRATIPTLLDRPPTAAEFVQTMEEIEELKGARRMYRGRLRRSTSEPHVDHDDFDRNNKRRKQDGDFKPKTVKAEDCNDDGKAVRIPQYELNLGEAQVSMTRKAAMDYAKKYNFSIDKLIGAVKSLS